MEEVQQSKLIFYIPVIISYLLACIVCWVVFRRSPNWKNTESKTPQKPWIELVISLIAVILIFSIGRLYSFGYLLPSQWNPFAWIVNNFIIYSPILVVLLVRRQSLESIWINQQAIGIKLLTGIFASVISVAVFLLIRQEGARLFEILNQAFSPKGLSNFPAVFFENVAIGFLFVRLKWVSNLKIALAIPSVLFALGHIPGMLAGGDPFWHILSMSTVTGGITGFVLYTCHKTQDIIWLALVHYFMDATIRAF